MNDWFDAEQHIERAHEHYEAGRWDEAESELREALSLNPYRAEWHFNLGLTLEAAGRAEDAVRAFRDAHELDPRDAQVLTVLGVNTLRVGEVADAVTWLEKARAIDPDRCDVYVHLIEGRTRLGEHEAAETCFYRAMQLEGDHALAYANIAESLMERADFKRAIYCLREAAGIDPKLPRVHARLASAYAATGRQERARQLYLRELREAPGDVETLLDLGCLLVEMNRFAEAGEKFRRVLELDGDHVEAHFRLGDLAMRQHRFKEAAASFSLVLKLEADYPEVRRRLARISLQNGEIAEARRHLRQDLRQLRVAPDQFNDDDLAELGRLLLDVRLPRDAAAVLESLAEKRPDDARTQHDLSVALFQSGQRAAGIEAARRALRLEPQFLPALHNMALASLQERQWSSAQYYLRQAAKLDPDDAGLRRLRLTLRLHRLGEVLAGLLRPSRRA